MAGDKSKMMQTAVDERGRIEIRISDLYSAIEYGEKLLDHYQEPAAAKFIREWSKSEMSRLASKRMTLGIDERDRHLMIGAQYAAMEQLGQETEKIEQTLLENQRTLGRAMTALASVNSKINKLKEK